MSIFLLWELWDMSLWLERYIHIKIKRPYVGQNRKEIREKILAKQVQLPEIPPFGWNRESVDFVNRLLQRNPEHRLGYKGIYEIKNHAWFKGFDW